MYNHQNGDNQEINKDDKKKRGRSPFRYNFKCYIKILLIELIKMFI